MSKKRVHRGTVTQRVADNLRARRVHVLERHQWGSRNGDVYDARRKNKPAKQPAGTVVQHITVTRPTSHRFAFWQKGKALAAFKADCRTVERIGMDRFGSGASYNVLVDMKHGFVAMGQPLDAKGTHTVNLKGVDGYSYDQNYAARAIAVIGMPDTPLSRRARRAITQALAAMVEENAVTEDFDYDPHSKFAAKDCPSDATRDQMPVMKRDALRSVR